MERLTNKHHADAQCKSYKKRMIQGYPRNIAEERFLKLAAYEDTGLEPSEVAAALAELKITREFICEQGLIFALASKLNKKGK